ncbi:hypothetical protein OROMI_009487 [Orobanche minor]
MKAYDETMHLILETMQAAVTSGHEVVASMEPVISSIMLSIWASHVSDPFISIDALEVLECYKKGFWMYSSFGFSSFTAYLLILSNPQQQPDGLVDGSLDLVTILVKLRTTFYIMTGVCNMIKRVLGIVICIIWQNAPIDVLKAAYQVLFDPVVRIVLQNNDHSEMQVRVTLERRIFLKNAEAVVQRQIIGQI